MHPRRNSRMNAPHERPSYSSCPESSAQRQRNRSQVSPLLVQKSGGTSVDGPERLRAVARRVAAARAAGHDTVVVVSAMGHTTDELIALAHQVSAEPQARE